MKKKRRYTRLYTNAEYNQRWMDWKRMSKFLDEITPIISDWSARLKKRQSLKKAKNK